MMDTNNYTENWEEDYEETGKTEDTIIRDDDGEPIILTKEIVTEIATEVAEDLLPRISVNTDNVQDFQLDENEFVKGLYGVSEIGGMIVGLMNAGLNRQEAIEVSQNIYLSNLKNDTDITLARTNKTAQI